MNTGSQHPQYDVMDNDFLYQQQHYLQQQHLQLQQQQYYLQQLSQQHGHVNLSTIQQFELERIRQVQQQATMQQQRALFHQQMMYYQQELQQEDRSSTSPSTQYQQEPFSSDKKAQKRAEHNAIERARRECLNTKFQQLAHSLPNLHDDKRPSKGTIIERTLEYVKETVEKEERLQLEIDQLRQVNEDLIKKMTSDHFDNLDQDDYDYENTPDCDDNLSSHSSITSNSSQQQQLYPLNQVFEKNENTSSLFLNRELQFNSKFRAM